MLRKWFSRCSMLTKTVIILVVTIIISGTITFALMTSTVSDVVTAQINQGTQNTLDVSATQLSSLTGLGTSILVSLHTDPILQEILRVKPETAYERERLFNSFRDVLNQAYYALEYNIRIAIASRYDDVYGNWPTFSASTLSSLKNTYFQRWESGQIPTRSLSSSLERDLTLVGEGLSAPEDFYVQYMPLIHPQSQELNGVAMVLIPVHTIYDIVRFTQEDIHNTYVTDVNGIIVAAKDNGQLGLYLDDVLKSASGTLSITARMNHRDQLCVTDLMSEHYIQRQTWLIVGRMAVYTAFSMLAIMAVCYLFMRKITTPLVKLTEKMVARDYRSFAQDNAADLGKNEIALLERGFEVMGHDIEELITLNREKERQKRKIELAALQSQIQPHFLFNTLNTVRCSIINQRNDKAAALVYELTMLLRMTLIKGEELIPLSQELENVGYYLSIIQMRHAAQFKYETDLSPLTEDFLVPKLLLQPLAENCVIHGFGQGIQGGVISISSECEDDFWYIRVRNNGAAVEHEIDLTQEKLTSSDRFSGIGILNVNNRLKLYFGESSGLRIYTDGEGWTVSELKIAYPRPSADTGERGDQYDADAC